MRWSGAEWKGRCRSTLLVEGQCRIGMRIGKGRRWLKGRPVSNASEEA